MKSIFISILFFSFLFENLHAKSFISTGQKIDLKSAILFATENSPDFDSLKRQLNVSELEQQSAVARLLPSLDLTATHGIKDTSPRTNVGPWNSEFNLGLTESLYDNGVNLSNYRIAVLTKNQAEVNFQDQKNIIGLNIVSQFLAYSLNVKLLEIQDKQFKFVNKQHDLISRDYYQGIKTKKDFLRFKTQVNRSEIDLINAKNAVDKSRQELQKLIGIDLNSNIDVEFLPISLDNVENEIADSLINLEQHLQHKSAQIQKEINQISSDLVARKNLPEWFISTGISYGSSNYLKTGQSLSDNGQVAWNALLTVKYNFFDWGIRSRDREVAAQKNIIQSNALDSTLLNLKSILNQLKINAQKIQ
ncbi:MAG: TolC family protein, partial [Bdellovibrionota bacterium]